MSSRKFVVSQSVLYTIDELKAELKIDIAEMGYISPGHGLKGKLNPLTGDDNLEDMYGEYKGKHDIMLW